MDIAHLIQSAVAPVFLLSGVGVTLGVLTGRLMVLIAFNNDVMDAWQWADDSRYPADKANVALRLGVNVVMYAMTH